MGYALRQHGLMAYDEERALVYVRILEDGSGDRLALVFAPSDNPGRSPINAAEALLAELSTFGLSRTLLAFPDLDGDEWFELQAFDGTSKPVRLSQQQVTALCGDHGKMPAANACRCVDLAPGDVLLQLVPEPEPERHPADDLRIVAVAALPWPHHPSERSSCSASCAYVAPCW